MKAFRNFGGNILEIEVDVDPDGNPILPPDTTVDPRPEPNEGHYVTVVGNEWVQIPTPVLFITFETKKQEALAKLKVYGDWYKEQPTEINGVLYDADEVARSRLSQACNVYSVTNSIPPAWIDYNNVPRPLASFSDLTVLVAGVYQAFSNRFFEIDNIRQQLMAATDEAALNAVVIPSIPMLR